LGAEEGLFILHVGKPGHDNRPRQIPGVRNVYQIKIEKHLGLALLISGILASIDQAKKKKKGFPVSSYKNLGRVGRF
jgi:hypothetical protein